MAPMRSTDLATLAGGRQVLHRPGDDDAVPVDLADPDPGPARLARLRILLLKEPVLR